MSETVHYTGKIKLVEKLENESLEDICQRILKENGFIELSDYCSSWQEMLYDQLYREYVIDNKNNNVYKVLSKVERDEYEMFEIKDNNDGTYDYQVMYYNGGMGFDEAIEESFKNMNK